MAFPCFHRLDRCLARLAGTSCLAQTWRRRERSCLRILLRLAKGDPRFTDLWMHTIEKTISIQKGDNEGYLG